MFFSAMNKTICVALKRIVSLFRSVNDTIHVDTMIQGVKWISVVIVLAYVDQTVSKLPALTEQKPTSYTWEFGALYNYFPDPPRVDGDVLIPFGTSTNNLRYIFVYDNSESSAWKKQIDADSSYDKLISVPNCKDLFETGAVRIRKYNNKYDSARAYFYYVEDRHYNERVQPSTESGLEQVPLTRIRTCCSPACTEKNFETIMGDKKSSEVVFYIYREGERKKYIEGVCVYCALKAGISKCKNGFFATDSVRLEQVPSSCLAPSDIACCLSIY